MTAVDFDCYLRAFDNDKSRDKLFPQFYYKSMPHDHTHAAPESGKRLAIVVALNFLISIAEVISGLLSGSLSLLSDALHNFSDGIAVIIAWIAIRLNTRPRNVDAKDAFQALRPGHGGPALSRRWWFIGYPGLVALAPFGRGDQRAMIDLCRTGTVLPGW